MEEILNKRLTEVSICSSHNSYINNFQAGNASVESVEKLINCGVRGIELDIFSKDVETFEPIVYHGDEELNISLTNKIPLSDFLKSINQIRKKSSLPLFLFFELNLSNYPYKPELLLNSKPKHPCSQVADLLSIFGNDLLTRTERNNRKPCDYTIGELQNRVIIFSGSGINSDDLYDKIAWNTGDSDCYENISEETIKGIKPENYEVEIEKSKIIFRRVYPTNPENFLSFGMDYRLPTKLGISVIAENLESYVSNSCTCCWSVSNCVKNYMSLYEESIISKEKINTKMDKLGSDINWCYITSMVGLILSFTSGIITLSIVF